MKANLERLKERYGVGGVTLQTLVTAAEDLMESEHAAWIDRMTKTIHAPPSPPQPGGGSQGRRAPLAKERRRAAAKVATGMEEPVKLISLLLPLLVSTPALADCKTVADDVVRHDQRIKAEANEFEARYGDIHIPRADDPVAVRRDFLRRLDSLIDAMQGDIDGLRWLIAHHCGPAEEEPNAIRSVHDMQLMLVALITRRMDTRALR